MSLNSDLASSFSARTSNWQLCRICRPADTNKETPSTVTSWLFDDGELIIRHPRETSREREREFCLISIYKHQKSIFNSKLKWFLIDQSSLERVLLNYLNQLDNHLHGILVSTALNEWFDVSKAMLESCRNRSSTTRLDEHREQITMRSRSTIQTRISENVSLAEVTHFVRLEELRSKTCRTEFEQTLEILCLEMRCSPRRERAGIQFTYSTWKRMSDEFVQLVLNFTSFFNSLEFFGHQATSFLDVGMPWSPKQHREEISYFNRFNAKTQLLTGTETFAPNHVTRFEKFLLFVLFFRRRSRINGNHFLVQILANRRIKETERNSSITRTARGSGSRSDFSRSSSR